MMEVEVLAKDTYTGAISGDFNRRNGLLQGIEAKSEQQLIKAKVPLRNLFGYVNDLRQMCAGRARASMKFVGYVKAPKELVKA